jgi:allantoicase
MTEHSSPSFSGLAELASSGVGGRALAANDDFFAARANLVKPEPPIYIPDKYTSRGKWMDGWESRRRRTPGHDWCVVRLGMRGVIYGVNVDTRFFTGNFPSHCSLDAIDSPGPLVPRQYGAEGAPWTTILSRTALRGDGDNYLAVDDRRPWTHVRLNIFPDGGVARLRVFGEVVVDWARQTRGARVVDLAAIVHGGLAIDASDRHYGNPNNMLMPGRARNMGGGWETRRRRGPGHDWAIVRLGTAGTITKVEIDTNHYKGNYPDSASLEGRVTDGSWVPLLPQTRLRAHHRHFFVRELQPAGPVDRVRLNIFPDGGISRLRVYGHPLLADANTRGGRA